MKTKINKDILVKVAMAGAIIGLVLSIISAIPILGAIVGCCLCIFIPFIGSATGYYTVKEHGIKSEDMTEGLMVGGIGGGVSGITYGIATSIIGAITYVIYQMFDIAISSSDSSSAVGSLAIAGAGSIFMIIVYPFMYGIVFAITGLIGGAIAASMNKDSKGTPVTVETK